MLSSFVKGAPPEKIVVHRARCTGSFQETANNFTDFLVAKEVINVWRCRKKSETQKHSP